MAENWRELLGMAGVSSVAAGRAPWLSAPRKGVTFHIDNFPDPGGRPITFDPQIEEFVQRKIAAIEDQFNRALQHRDQKIEGLEKTLKQFNWDPQLHKMVKDKLDYTTMISDEEEMLEEDYRGWPTPKERIIF